MLTWMDLVANSTPMVDLDSKLNSFLVNRDSRLDLPTPESPIRTTVEGDIVKKKIGLHIMWMPSDKTVSLYNQGGQPGLHTDQW